MTDKESLRLDELKQFEENLYNDEGCKLICGIDEVNRLVYKIEKNHIEIIQCKGHYE